MNIFFTLLQNYNCQSYDIQNKTFDHIGRKYIYYNTSICKSMIKQQIYRVICNGGYETSKSFQRN